MPTADLQGRIERNSIPEPNSGCWLWLGSVDRDGYGTSSIDGRSIRAHRVSYSAFNGPIPSGLLVLHRCDVPSCVNPDHLWVGSSSDNARDCYRKGRHSGRAPRDAFGATMVRGGKWKAQITIKGKNRHLGTFDTKDEAHAAYRAAAE